MTPLGHAVQASRLDSMKLLVKMGAAINTQDKLGRTPLAMAAYQVCQNIYLHGAQALKNVLSTHKTNWEETPLAMVAYQVYIY